MPSILVTQYGSEATDDHHPTPSNGGTPTSQSAHRTARRPRTPSSFASTARWSGRWPASSSTRWRNCCSDLRQQVPGVSTSAYSVSCMQKRTSTGKGSNPMAQDDELAAVAGDLAAAVSNAAQDIGLHQESAGSRRGVGRQLAERAGVSNPYLSQRSNAACGSRPRRCWARSPGAAAFRECCTSGPAFSNRASQARCMTRSSTIPAITDGRSVFCSISTCRSAAERRCP